MSTKDVLLVRFGDTVKEMPDGALRVNASELTNGDIFELAEIASNHKIRITRSGKKLRIIIR